MKTIGKIALIATALTIGFSGSLSASPRGKHAFESASHKHVASNTSRPYGDYVLLKRIGPPGKGFVRTNAYRGR